jgi:hypothetical protein
MPTARVSDLMDVDDAGDGRVSVSEQEGNFVEALAREQGAEATVCRKECIDGTAPAGISPPSWSMGATARAFAPGPGCCSRSTASKRKCGPSCLQRRQSRTPAGSLGRQS